MRRFLQNCSFSIQKFSAHACGRDYSSIWNKQYHTIHYGTSNKTNGFILNKDLLRLTVEWGTTELWWWRTGLTITMLSRTMFLVSNGNNINHCVSPTISRGFAANDVKGWPGQQTSVALTHMVIVVLLRIKRQSTEKFVPPTCSCFADVLEECITRIIVPFSIWFQHSTVLVFLPISASIVRIACCPVLIIFRSSRRKV